LEPLTPNGGQFETESHKDPKRVILDECTGIDRAINEVDQVDLKSIEKLQQALINNPDPSTSTTQLDNASSQIMATYRSLVDRIRRLKSKPESGNLSSQIGRVERKLKEAMHNYQKLDAEFRKKLQEQMARQYRIVRPEASEQEVRKAVENTSDQQVFSQALMQSNRRGQAQSALSAVQSRHEEIQKIERQMIELAELFQDMENLVVQQEAAVTNIEMKGEEVVDNMHEGNEQIGVAIKSARNTRKWKWWCLGIVGMFEILFLGYPSVLYNSMLTNTP
jgi:syntaxin 1B/2/3